MTFSQMVKEELLSIKSSESEFLIELIAIIRCLGSIQTGYNHNQLLTIKTTQLKIVKKVVLILKHFFPECQYESMVSTRRSFKELQKNYTIVIYKDVDQILLRLKLVKANTSNIVFLEPIDFATFSEEQKNIYIRMCFCCLGSVNTPKKEQQYHLEIRISNEDDQKFIINHCIFYGINFRITKRKSGDSLYLNKSEEIGDFLKMVGSTEMLFKFEDERILRDLYLVTNRINNADIANAYKSQNASLEQLNAIKKLQDSDLFEHLGDKTKKVADLRLKYPQASLQELADINDCNLSKSNISYHLKMIIKQAQNL